MTDYRMTSSTNLENRSLIRFADGKRLFLPLSQAMSSDEIDEFRAEYQRKKRT